MSILVIFAAFGSIGFGRSLAALLWMAIILCAVIGAMRREQPFGAALNHWDETVAYAALFCAGQQLQSFRPGLRQPRAILYGAYEIAGPVALEFISAPEDIGRMSEAVSRPRKTIRTFAHEQHSDG